MSACACVRACVRVCVCVCLRVFITFSFVFTRIRLLCFFFSSSTFVCPTEILAFNDRITEFNELNAEIVVCSVDSHFTHLAWTNTSRKNGGLGSIKIPMLSDLNRKISQDYGVYVPELGHTLRYSIVFSFNLIKNL